MMKTIVFGGTFDPPHEGHKNLLQSVMAHGYDNAIVLPAKIPPHKSRGETDDFNERLAAAKDFFGDMENVTVSDLEGLREGKSYTVDTLAALRQTYPDREWYLLIGSDMLLSIEQWYRFEDIFAQATVVCAARTAKDREKIRKHREYLVDRYGCNIIIYNINIIELSSTQLRSPLVQKIEAHNRVHLSEKRYAHVKSVADYAVYLASLHGIDPFKAYVAALAHDCTKYMDDGAQLDYLASRRIPLSADERAAPKILHQISGAQFAKEEFGIEDEDILNAIRWHTTGRKGMSRLEKLICLADSIEPRREYPGVEEMRTAAEKSIDRALLMSMERLVRYIDERGLHRNAQTTEALEEIRKENTMDEIKTILDTAVKTLYKKKGKEIQILKVDDITVMADYFVLCSGSSNTQIKALAGEVEFQLSQLGIEPLHTEGYGSSEWVLLDYGSVIIHIFYKTAREYYKLERLWADGTEIPLSEFVSLEEEHTDEI